jgi:hypothetical protein
MAKRIDLHAEFVRAAARHQRSKPHSAEARNAKNLLQAAIMDKGNDLDDVKAAGLMDKVKDLKSKGIL